MGTAFGPIAPADEQNSAGHNQGRPGVWGVGGVPALVVSCAILLIGSANAHLRTFPYMGVYGHIWLCRKSCVLSKLVRSPLQRRRRAERGEELLIKPWEGKQQTKELDHLLRVAEPLRVGVVSGERFVEVARSPRKQGAQALVRELVAHGARAGHVERCDDVVLDAGLEEYGALVHHLGLVREVQGHERVGEVLDDRGNRAVVMAQAEWNDALGSVGLAPEMVAVDCEILRDARCQLRVAREMPFSSVKTDPELKGEAFL